MTKLYAFWPKHHEKLRNTTVFRYQLHEMDPEEASLATCPYEEVQQDDSRVGTALKGMFQSFGFTPGNCNCEAIAKTMDRAGLDFLSSHAEDFVDLIFDSASQMRIYAPKAILRRFVRLAIWREKRRLNREEINGRPVVETGSNSSGPAGEPG